MEAHRLYHVSEEANLTTSIPRPVPSPDTGVRGNAVWAIDDAHLPNYLLPRDCPRICFRLTGATTEADRIRFFGDSRAQHVIVLEDGWRSRAGNFPLYVYEFSWHNFALANASAGYYISREEVTPLSCTGIDEPLKELSRRSVDVRFVDNLWELRNSVVKSSLEFSVIRFRNARSPAGNS